jgi:predicted GNAT family acetyltransferase
LDLCVDERYELNEVGWWANWAGMTWLTQKAYIMYSGEFKEPFFNRAGFVGMESEWSGILSKMQSIFVRQNLRPCIYVQQTEEFSDLRAGLAARAYVVADKMFVMEMRRPSFQVNHEIRVGVTREEEAKEWCEAYLQSFYGDLELLTPTLEIVLRSMKRKAISFVSAKYEESVVGTLVTYRSQDVVGVYCVGTIPGFRKKGVANTMMQFANDISSDVGTMILQTMLSDGLEDLYQKMGMAKSYAKEVFMGRD